MVREALRDRLFSMPRLSKPRLFRPWSKKRGKRSLSGTLSGAAGEAVFYAALFLLGVFGFSLVLVNQLAPQQAPDVSAEAFSGGLATWIFGVLSLAAIGSGSAGLFFRLTRLGTSSERRSALASRAQSIEVLVPAADQATRLPNVPQGRSLTDSPGERLRYRLAANHPAAGGVAGAAFLALLWNAVWFILLAVVISGFWYSRPRWVLTGLLVPFGGIGIWSFRFFVSQLRHYAGVGSTLVEISDQPLVPGQPYELYVAQMGRLRLRWLKIELICEEETFYRQGTDTRVDHHQVYTQPLHTEKNLRIDPQRPWEQQLRFDLPDHVMHSFVGSHNAIRWKIVVTGESRPWPSFCRSFPVVVHPPGLPPRRSPR